MLQLADLANLTQPWAVDPTMAKGNNGVPLLIGFKNTNDAPADLEELEREYCKSTRQPYPIPEMVFARSWMLFRVRIICRVSGISRGTKVTLVVQLSVILQGIAARWARRQASSEKAPLYSAVFPLVSRLAIAVIEESGDSLDAAGKAKL